MEGILSGQDDDSAPGSDKWFWRFIKHKKQETQGVAPLKKSGKLADDPVMKANILNDQSQSVFSSGMPLSLKLCIKAAGFVKADGQPQNHILMPKMTSQKE